ncbi:DUF1064 domain-containing protein [Tritonibacter mobilis]|uniref:DUF1064 domain-containing protein n=1 Tax=Tritonibacter mobilis TaxID=379347 RepID=UPI000B5807EB|nr:DUF1064 domain-containing protein [Tritonibacter mobilis]ANH49053.1 hypothetical protein [Ruegeria phage 45A6]
MRMSAKQYRDQAEGRTNNKFGAQRITVDGIKFDSKREANRWLELRNLERAGQITDLRRQVVVELQGRDGPLLTRTGRKMRITVDFAYVDLRNEATAGLTIYEDAKGKPTRDYEVRRAVAAAQGVEVHEV